MSIFSIQNLRVSFGVTEVVRGVSFSVNAGKTLAVIGESGSGKSTSFLGSLGLLPSSASVSGSVLYNGRELLHSPRITLRKIYGSKIGFIFQDPMNNLHPLKTIGDQVAEAVTCHRKIKKKELHELVAGLLEEVGITDPLRRMDQYPRQLSGGLRQRVMIAISLALKPDVVIADEPTTALDVTVQAAVLDLLKRLQQRHKMALIFISHDLALVSDIADDVAVMRDGIVVEQSCRDDIYSKPQHRYTRDLLEAARFNSKNLYISRKPLIDNQLILDVKKLGKSFTLDKSVIKDVSFSINKGEILGLVGESGSGKSTIARIVAGLERQDRGILLLDGQCYSKILLDKKQAKKMRKTVQMVFQDPYGSLNPRRSIFSILSDCFADDNRSSDCIEKEIINLLNLVELSSELRFHFPSQLSGGQRQRVAIARAIASYPALIVADEPVSALDITTQTKIVSLLRRLCDEFGISFLFISHDLKVVAELCDRVAILYKGRIIESGSTQNLFKLPKENYTKKLLSSMPGRNKIGLSFLVEHNDGR